MKYGLSDFGAVAFQILNLFLNHIYKLAYSLKLGHPISKPLALLGWTSKQEFWKLFRVVIKERSWGRLHCSAVQCSAVQCSAVQSCPVYYTAVSEGREGVNQQTSELAVDNTNKHCSRKQFFSHITLEVLNQRFINFPWQKLHCQFMQPVEESFSILSLTA